MTRRDWWTRMHRRRTDVRMWVVDHVPVAFLTSAHELAIALVLLSLAIPATLGVLPRMDETGVPVAYWQAWSWTMIAGATSTWYGVLRSRPRLEWLGQLLAGWGLALFSLRLATLGLAYTYPTVMVFTILAVVSWWRAWKISSMALVQHRLTRAAREAHVRVYGREKQT